MGKMYHTIFVVIILLADLHSLKGEAVNRKPFVPTNEWQVVEEGDVLPAGLHYRINFTSHTKEAKLLEKEPNPASNSIVVVADDSERTEAPKSDAELAREFYQSLKTLKTFDSVADLTAGSEDTLKDNGTQQFRSIEEIRSELGDLFGMNIKTEIENIRDWYDRINTENIGTDELVGLLNNLEELTHSYDNGKYFAEIGGGKVLLLLFNSSVPEIRHLAAVLFSAASQSNLHVQLNFLALKLPQLLLEQYSKDLISAKDFLSAISALLRGCLQCQSAFQDMNGFLSLTNIMRTKSKPCTIKVVTLFSDLLTEREERASHANSLDRHEDNSIDAFLAGVTKGGWCDLVPALLVSDPAVDFVWDGEGSWSLDQIEKLLLAMITLSPYCPSLRDVSSESFARLKAFGWQLTRRLSTMKDKDSYLLTIRDLFQRLQG